MPGESPLSVLRSRGLRPSKKRGQHFLVDARVARRILEHAAPSVEDVVVEVGAGLGALTGGLADRARSVLAVEVDRGLAGVLEERLGGRDNVAVESDDILNVNLREVAGRYGVQRVRVVGNLPYCITAPILLWIVRQAEVVADAVVMVQAEVAERLAAPPGGANYGPLTIAVQFWSRPEVLLRVSPGCFRPTPGVESALVRLSLTGRARVAVRDEALYFDVVRKVFSQRRKMLKNSLLQLEGVNEGVLRAVEARTGLDLTRRPQEFGLDAFARLVDALGALA